jgi:tetratricopeptide (TPR) repeat protein
MTVSRPLLAIIVAGALGVPRAASTQASPSYSEVLDLYHAGRTEAARAGLSRLSDQEVESGRQQILRALEHSPGYAAEGAADWLRVAAMVHTEAGFALDATDRDAAARHLLVARGYMEKLVSRDRPAPLSTDREERALRARAASFSRDWWLLLIAYFQGQLELSQARDFAKRAREVGGDTPELWLATGITQEMAWTSTHGAGARHSFTGDLDEAEAAYRRALAGQGELVEAKIRLGRVLALQGKFDESLRELATIGAGEDVETRYLARLFEGDALERHGNLAEAERRYLAAFAAEPMAQSVRLALAHLQHVSGGRWQAAAQVRATVTSGAEPEKTDPWFWYTRGLLWRSAGYLQALRSAVQQ